MTASKLQYSRCPPISLIDREILLSCGSLFRPEERPYEASSLVADVQGRVSQELWAYFSLIFFSTSGGTMPSMLPPN